MGGRGKEEETKGGEMKEERRNLCKRREERSEGMRKARRGKER